MIGESLAQKNKHTFGLLYVSSFVLSFHLFFVVYMNSSFLSTFVDERLVGSIYIISSAISIPALIYIARLLRLVGNYKTLLALTFVEFFIFLGLAFSQSFYTAVPLFILHAVTFPLILFNFDVFLEGYTKQEGETGAVRGTFLTVVNMALILAPLVSGLMLTNGDYWKIYLTSALFLIPFLMIIRSFKDFKDPEYHRIRIRGTLRCIIEHKNLYNILMSQFIMRFFFSWMVIYMPIYLHAHIGFSWAEIGFITAIMLLPFVLLEYPAGKIADKYLGEKELLITGFLIAGVFTFLLAFITANTFIVWAMLLLITRIGASLIEIMSESYFFKHVNATDNNTIGFFRITRPVAYVAGPAVGTLALLFMDIQHIWVVLGLVTLAGIFFAFRIEDTR